MNGLRRQEVEAVKQKKRKNAQIRRSFLLKQMFFTLFSTLNAVPVLWHSSCLCWAFWFSISFIVVILHSKWRIVGLLDECMICVMFVFVSLIILFVVFMECKVDWFIWNTWTCVSLLFVQNAPRIFLQSFLEKKTKKEGFAVNILLLANIKTNQVKIYSTITASLGVYQT